MEPILKQQGQTVDCSTIIFVDDSIIPTNLPSFLVLKVGLFDKEQYDYILINSTSTVKLSDFLAKSPILLNSFTLGKTSQTDSLSELTCGVIQVDYHWLYTTSKPIVFQKSSYEVNGSNLDIKDSVYINNEVYTIDKVRSTTSKLITKEPLKSSGGGLLTYGEFNTYYFIQDCQIKRGHIKAVGELSVLDCTKDTHCLTSPDKDQAMLLLKRLMQLESARVKLSCGDVISANQLIRDLCATYSKDCYNGETVIGDSRSPITINSCTSCG